MRVHASDVLSGPVRVQGRVPACFSLYENLPGKAGHFLHGRHHHSTQVRPGRKR